MTRTLRIELAAALAVAAAGLLPPSPAAVTPGIPALYVNYTADCTFTLEADGGISVTSSTPPGPTLPPGTYQLLIWMPNPTSGYAPCARPAFALTGPGVSSVTVFPGQELHAEVTVILQPSATYVAEDQNAPAATQEVFSTAASGSSTSLLGPTTTTASGAGGSVQPDLVGSAVPPYRGKLAARISSAGKATLTVSGQAVGILKPGRYDVAVTDATASAGLFVRQPRGGVLTLSSRRFVGERARQMTLTDGTWTFSSGVGRPTRIVVRL